ncbi:MAG: DUF4743 domain-containing protein [Casimicrobiaceae bacterium]
MIENALLERIHGRLAAAVRPARGPFTPLSIDGAVTGWLDDARAARLARFGEVFRVDHAALEFVAALRSEPARTEAMADVARILADEGLLTAWRDEAYAVAASPGAAPAFMVERAAARYLGVLTQAAHVNGLIAHQGDLAMWLARRSTTKAIDPGLLDNLVGGGVRAGTSIEDTLRREAWEEAGITRSVIARARPVGMVRLCREQPDGLQREIIHIHDLRLPGNYTPECVDGEAIAHRLVDLADVAELIAHDTGPDVVTADASLVILDCLFRHGAIAPDRPLSMALADLRWPPLTPA